MALFSYNRPSGITWALSGGTGAAFIGAQSLLTNGRPADACRVQGFTTAPVNTDVITLTGTLGKTIAARCAGFLLPSATTATPVPAGINVQVSGKLSGGGVALGGNSTTTNLQTLANGAAAAWYTFPAANIDQVIFTIPNNKAGATWLAASGLFDIGELWIGTGADFQAKQDLGGAIKGGLLDRDSHNNQAWPLSQQGYKAYTLNLLPMTEAVAIGPNAVQDDFETVAYAFQQGASGVIIPAYMNRGSGPLTNGTPPAVITTATINAQRLVRYAKLGVCDDDITFAQDGDVFVTAAISFGETPP